MTMMPRESRVYGNFEPEPTVVTKPKVKAPSEITIKWLIERDACKEGMLRFLEQFPTGVGSLCEYNLMHRFSPSDEKWLRQQIEGPLPWESKEYHKARGLAKLTQEEKEALGL